MLALVMSAAFLVAAPQGPGPQEAIAGVPAADSQRIVRHARSAQSSFESFRRLRLPIGYRSSDPCEIRIGRYCYWRGDEADDAPPPAEQPAIRERRASLIRTLDSASTTLPGDAWLAGQTVRYLVEVDSTDAALRVAHETCHATASWCHALAGYAAHKASRFALADSEFTLALAAMDSSERCRWLDISNLISDALADAFDKAGCTERERLARRAMRAGAPLYSVSETDLLTEHLTRVTRAHIAEHSAAPDGEAWADDIKELMVRYGWPRWYSRTQPDFGSQRSPSIIGHDTGMPYDFIPTLTMLEHVGKTTADDWHLDDPRALTGYAPSYLRTIHELPSQIARFRRGDTTLVVAGWDARRDTTLIGRPLDAALVLWADDSTRAVVRTQNARTTGALVASAVMDSGLVSLELLAASDRRAARARIGLAPRDSSAIALSDILLYAPTAGPADALDAVQDSALASTVIPMSREVGAYWETYGLGPTTKPIHYTLTVEPTDISWLRRVAERLRFADPTRALRLQWQEVPQRVNGIAGRGVRVGMSQLRAGKYRIELTARAPGGGTATSMRDVEVR